MRLCGYEAVLCEAVWCEVVLCETVLCEAGECGNNMGVIIG